MMNADSANFYRAGMFDGEPDTAWLARGWRALRLYGRRAKAAILAGDPIAKADMIARADQLLNLMSGLVDTKAGTTLGPALMTIYAALRFTLLRANMEDSPEALDDFETALALLDRDMTTAEPALAA